MAFLYFKSMVFGSSRGNSYTLLPHTQSNDHSRDQSLDSTSSASTTTQDHSTTEKIQEDGKQQQSTASSTSKPWKIDARIISDLTIGLSDGLTVPFALASGLSALGDTKVVLYGGFAEIIAGSISMALGGFLGARSEAQAYDAALSESRKLVENDTAQACDLVRSSMDRYQLSPKLLDDIVAELLADPTRTVGFLMRQHHQMPDSACTTSRAYVSALTIAAGYFFGGLTPLMPYVFAHTNQVAFIWSAAVMVLTLFVFGYVKTMLVGEVKRSTCFVAGLQMIAMGGVAAAAAVGCVKAIGGIER